MRVFVAIDLPDAFRRRATEVCDGLKPLCPEGRWVRPESMHLTLKFIGEAAEAKVEEIRGALGEVRRKDPVTLRIQGVWPFPNERRASVVAVLVQSPDAIDLAGKIDWQLKALGIPVEKRSFRPHLTLARIDPRQKHPALRKELEKLREMPFGTVETSEFHLYQSTLKRGGAVYARLQTYRFVESA